jgi:hypothetical protein
VLAAGAAFAGFHDSTMLNGCRAILPPAMVLLARFATFRPAEVLSATDIC